MPCDQAPAQAHRAGEKGALHRVLLACLFLVAGAAGVRGAEPARPNILVLNSYHPGYLWSDDELAGILEAFAKVDPLWQSFVEYLDCRHFPRGEHLEQFAEYLRGKYRGVEIKLVLAADNQALDFILKYRPALFPNVPIVFCGVNGYAPEMLAGQTGVTGVAEVLDTAGTLEAMLRLHPGTQEVLVIHDFSVTGQSSRAEFDAIAPQFSGRVQFRLLPNLALAGVLSELEGLSGERLVLVLSYTNDKTGLVLNHPECAKLFSEHCAAPIYAVHERRLGYGIVGGSLIEGKTHATRAAALALRILAGEDPNRIPVDTSAQGRLMFDYNQLRRFGIPVTALPAGSIVINQPVSFYERYKTLVEVTVAVVLGLVLVVFVLTTNIVKRHRVEGELRESRERLLEAQRIACLGSWHRDIVTDTSVFSDECCRIFGIDRRAPAPQRQKFLDRIHPEDRERFTASYGANLKTAGTLNHEFRILLPGGEVRNIQAVARVIHDESGRPLELVGTVLDITDRKRAEEEIRRLNETLEARVKERTAQLEQAKADLEQEIGERRRAEAAWREQSHFLNVLLDALPTPVFYKDAQGRFLGCNAAFETFIGRTREQFIGKGVGDVYPPNLATLHLAADEALFRQGGLQRYENPMPLPDGTRREVVFHKALFQKADGTTGGLVGAIFDITDRKNAEDRVRRLNIDLHQRAADLQAVNKELESFSYSVSHDLRAPLRAIDGFSQALLEDCAGRLTPEGEDHLRRIRNATRHMGTLIDDLLRLAHVTRAELRNEAVDLSAFAETMAAELRRSAPERQVEFIIAPGLRAEGDPDLLRLVIENLLSNAWKFTSKQPQARIEVGTKEHGGVPAFFVRDNGTGFNMDYATKLFRPFQRLHTVAEFPGTGIGLATVRRIVVRHGGRVWAEGREGEGATFSFTLKEGEWASRSAS